jgi:hypothetical protein
MPRVAQAPPPGVARNATPEATPGRWFDANNIRFRQGLLQPIGGNVAIPNAVTVNLPRDVLTWHDNTFVHWAAIGTDTKLYAYRFDTQVLYDITPSGVGPLQLPGPTTGYGLGDYGASTYGTSRDPADIGVVDIAANQGDMWSLATFGEDLLFVPTQDGHLYHWSPATPTTAPDLVANAPTMNRGVFVTDQRQVGLIGAGGDPRMVAWSDQENYTVWAPNVTNLAGSKQLVTQSTAMCTVKVSSGILIFTAHDLHIMTYVGPPYAYGIVQIASGCGPISQRAPVAIGSTVIWPGARTFWQWAGSVVPIPCEVEDWFYSLVNRAYVGRIFGSPNPPFAEMWWDWPDQDNTECNRYLGVNFTGMTTNQLGAVVASRSWIIGTRNRTAADPASTADNPVLGGPLGSGGSLFLHEYGYTENGAPRAATGAIYAESGAITLGEGDQRYNVTQLVFDAACTVDDMLGYSFTVRENPYDEASEFNTGLYTVVSNGLMDMRWSGRTAQMRVEPLYDGDFAIGRPRLIIKPAGKR